MTKDPRANRPKQNDPPLWRVLPKSGKILIGVVLGALAAVLLGLSLVGQDLGAPRAVPAAEPAASACADAVAKAASVPADEINDVEVAVTLNACTTYAEWAAAVQADPMIFGVSSVPSSELPIYVEVACWQDADAPVCQDAASEGVI